MNMSTTPGDWYVTTQNREGKPNAVICVKSTASGRIVAVTGVEGAPDEAESIANAAAISIVKPMMDALIAIQETINPANDETVIDLIAMNTMISDIFAKLANEAGLQ